MSSFRCTEIARLKHELTLAPLRHRLRQLAGISRAISLIDPRREYPFSFVCFQITGYRPRRTEDVLLDGRNVIEDLVTLANALTALNPIPASAAMGRLYSADALAKRFRVTVRTITRWCRRGLVGGLYEFGEPKPRLAFAGRDVQCFVSRNLDLVHRGAAFRPVCREEKALMIAQAREWVATERCCLHVVMQRLAKQTGRAPETIRQTLRRFDRENPSQALFDRTEQAQELDERQVIYQAFVDGRTVRQLAKRFSKSVPQIHRILTGVRARELSAEPIAYLHHPSFDAPDAELDIMGPASPDSETAEKGEEDIRVTGVPSGLPPYLASLYRTPLLAPAEERCQFRRMNFLRHKAELRRREIAADPDAADPADIAAIEALLEQATEVKNRITAANLRLVVSIARRHAAGRPTVNLFELVSDGNLSLMRAVDKFDFGRGFRFSTYASWAIMRFYARAVPEAMNHESRFRTGHDEVLASVDDYRSARSEADAEVESVRQEIRTTLADHLAALSPRDRAIVQRRFGLDGTGAAKTLEQVGREMGISRERVRQIELRALRQLRTTLGDSGAELLAG